jgi:bacillithiol biosynthesis cysteine-adding enzyme BshC
MIASMQATATSVPYSQTGKFSKLVIDYLAENPVLEPFWQHRPNWEGLEASMQARRQFATNRPALVAALREQYQGMDCSPLQQQYLQDLLSDDCFTITTAHQPNLFTGPLYFVYKIIHAIRLADELRQRYPQQRFVPVYYMGSEDADLDELGHFVVQGEKRVWNTSQTGAVGRMKTTGLAAMADQLLRQFGHESHADYLRQLLDTYTAGNNIQQATFRLVHALFANYGLLVVIPDNAALKQLFVPVVQKELTESFSNAAVERSIAQLEPHYKIQVRGREINLFYLDEEGRRERIERSANGFKVTALGLRFSKEEMLQLAAQRPELFSANVILRGVFQETILPNIAFIGGGGELAYWLELKQVFGEVAVPFPVLLLRNSFALLNQRMQYYQQRTGLTDAQLFLPLLELQNELAKAALPASWQPDFEEAQLRAIYDRWLRVAASVDASLQGYVAALHTQAIKGLHKLETKLLRAQRRKLEDTCRQVEALHHQLFPGGGLQERTENILPLLARYGPQLLQWIYDHSSPLPGQFTLLRLPY